MDIMELGAIGELVGGVAVIATLIYLALQIRNSTSLAQGTSERDLMEAVQKMTDRVAGNATIWLKGLHSFTTLSRQDQLVFTSMLNPWINHLEQTLRMHTRGLLSQDNVDLYGDICLSMVQEPGGREVWERTKPLYFSMSRDYIQHRLDDGTNLPPPWHGLDDSREF